MSGEVKQNTSVATGVIATAPSATQSASNPTTSTNPENVGAEWHNTTSGQIFIATTITASENVWYGQTGVTKQVNDRGVIGGGNPGGRSGGSGIVLVRNILTVENMTLISNAVTADAVPTLGDLIITYSNATGTAVVGTDLKAYISRNGSAYTGSLTFTDLGTTGGHQILAASAIDISGITSGTSMKWKIELLNQSAAKSTRIQAVSLGWS